MLYHLNDFITTHTHTHTHTIDDYTNDVTGTAIPQYQHNLTIPTVQSISVVD